MDITNSPIAAERFRLAGGIFDAIHFRANATHAEERKRPSGPRNRKVSEEMEEMKKWMGLAHDRGAMLI
ncbi:MAG: hypothetical protein DMG49_26525 [Acidobacteria bacterium]|nr:MAG: hypothetical protein DMG49_26525 [Acidobacteriota bacterium]